MSRMNRGRSAKEKAAHAYYLARRGMWPLEAKAEYIRLKEIALQELEKWGFKSQRKPFGRFAEFKADLIAAKWPGFTET